MLRPVTCRRGPNSTLKGVGRQEEEYDVEEKQDSNGYLEVDHLGSVVGKETACLAVVRLGDLKQGRQELNLKEKDDIFPQSIKKIKKNSPTV